MAREVERALGFPVAVYRIIVLWGQFDLEPRWIGDVCVLNGHVVADWLMSRPADLLNDRRRRVVMDYVRSIPRA